VYAVHLGEVSPRQAARIAGYGYLAIFVLAIFANFFVRERLVEPGDAAATASNIAGSEGLFRVLQLVGLLCFGVHLALLGSLVLTSGDIPKVLGVLLILAGAGYVIDTLANALLANYGDYETAFLLIVAVPSVIGELAFTIWLLSSGARERQPEVKWRTSSRA
jgi:hypothetical protein